jgi:hypothetical protein
MMLLRGYAEPVTTCDVCLRALERADGTITVTFKGLEARFACPHCRQTSVRTLRIPDRIP